MGFWGEGVGAMVSLEEIEIRKSQKTVKSVLHELRIHSTCVYFTKSRFVPPGGM